MRNLVLPLTVFIALFTGGPSLTVSQAQQTPQVAVEQAPAAASSAQQPATEPAKSAETAASAAINPQWQPPSDWAL